MLSIVAKNQTQLWGGLTHPIGEDLLFLLPQSDALCLGFSRSKYNASAINYLLIVVVFTSSTLQPKITVCV